MYTKKLLIVLSILYVNYPSAVNPQMFKSLANKSTRIVGGEAARAREFKFAVAITVQTADSRFFCGGALLTNVYVLTAAQCVHEATLLTLRLGSTTLTGDDPNRVTVATSDYIIHPDFNPATLEHDIGLIKLRLPIELTDYIDTIHYKDSSPITDYTGLLAIGWGQVSDEDAELNNELHWVQLASITNSECRQSYGNQVTDNMVCVAGNYNEGTCIGDSGGPLIQVVSRGQMVHTGVASFISGNGCESSDPSGYTRIYPYLEWIKNITLTSNV